ncbi:MAG: ABC transporter ATP-binding protein [Candidatus Heimdallarchaeota archaeon]|nr:ABC transporter ATP-binding protein [Candidatus Heimdallarchaeota archaeon]
MVTSKENEILKGENVGDSDSAIGVVDLKKHFVSKNESENVKAVDGLSFSIMKGEIFGLLGPNGAGKTTFIRMLVGLLKPTSGQILFNGEELNVNSAKLKNVIGYVPQEAAFWKDLTVYENLSTIGTTYKIPNKELKERIDHLLDGLYLMDQKKKKASKLSGGMQRRLNLAMGMVHHPQILLLDEVFVGLDPQTRNYLYDYLRDFASKENKTIIITSHLMEIVDSLSDRVGILDLGKMLAVDTPENLKNTHGKGDILQLEIDKDFDDSLVSKIDKAVADVSIEKNEQNLVVKTLNAIAKLPEILNIVEAEGFLIQDVKLTKQSLETVFISLTGKELRV